MFDKKTTVFAAQQLGLPEDHELVYQSIHVGFIYDEQALAKQITSIDPHDDDALTVEEVIEEAQTYVELPPGMRLVGMSAPESKELKFGFVDFTALGAA